MLTNRRYSFKHASSTETGLNDHHHFISSTMETAFEKEESKVLVYQDYKHFNFNSFKSKLLSKFHRNIVTFTSFENNFVNVLNQQAPKKSKVFHRNQKPHLNKSLRSAIMKHSRLKNKANKSQLPADLSKYKKQRNLVVKLTKKHKKEYFENLNVATNSKPFWDKCKPYFSNKHAKGDSNIMLIEKDEILLKNKKIADVFNSYFDSVTDSLDLFSWSTQTDNKNTDALQNILKRFHNHPRLIKIKQLVNNQAKFSFQPVSVYTVKEVIEGLPSNKATAGEIPIKVLKESGITFEYLTSCVDEAISSGKFPDSLKLLSIVTVHKKKDPTDKCNYRPVSILPVLSKVFEKMMHNQLYIYMNNFLNELLRGFRKVHSTQLCKHGKRKLTIRNSSNYTHGSVKSI